jgi:hypothetical protein
MLVDRTRINIANCDDGPRPILRAGRRLTDAPTVVLSHAAWEREFAGDRTIVGKSVILDVRCYEVIGVAAPASNARWRGLGSEASRIHTSSSAGSKFRSRISRGRTWLIVTRKRSLPDIRQSDIPAADRTIEIVRRVRRFSPGVPSRYGPAGARRLPLE